MTGMTIIKIEGLLDREWETRFDGMHIHHEAGNTVLTGNIEDESNMHGLLYILRDYNLKLISINPAKINHLNNQKPKS